MEFVAPIKTLQFAPPSKELLLRYSTIHPSIETMWKD